MADDLLAVGFDLGRVAQPLGAEGPPMTVWDFLDKRPIWILPLGLLLLLTASIFAQGLRSLREPPK